MPTTSAERWDAFAIFAAQHHGNLAALLRYWHEHMGQGQGKPGDYDNCVSVLSKHPDKIDNPHALCQWLHIQSTGHPAGHAPAEQKAKHAMTTQLVQFKDYDAETRREFAKKGWALPDGSFPIANVQDLKNALHRIGTTKHPRSQVIAHIRKRAKALGATDVLGEKTSPKKAAAGAPLQDAANHAAKFSGRIVTDRGTVIRRGKVFEAGSRLDMHGIPFTVTPDDLAAMVVNFRPFPVGSGHPEAPSPLDGHLGTVTNLFLGSSPTDLYAEAEIPLFVDDVLGETEAKVSMVFDRGTKEPLGLDFVNDPNVVDAALTTAFARFAGHDTPYGRSTMQAIHDVAARRGAVCRPNALYASTREHAAVQQIHNITSEHGAVCKTSHATGKMPMGIDFKKMWRDLFAVADELEQNHAEFAGTQSPGKASEDYEANWQEKRMGMPVDQPVPSVDPDHPEFIDSTWQEEQRGLMSDDDDCDDGCCDGSCDCGDCPRCGGKENESGVTEANPMAPAKLSSTQPLDMEKEQLRQELMRARADRDRERATRIESEAVSFAETEVREHRSLPAEQEMLAELYRIFAADDLTSDMVKLSSGQVSWRTEWLRAAFASRPEHWITKEQMAATMNPEVIAMAVRTQQANEPPPMDAERKAKLLAMTETGKMAAKYSATAR